MLHKGCKPVLWKKSKIFDISRILSYSPAECFKPSDRESGDEKSLWCTYESLHVDFVKKNVRIWNNLYIEELKAKLGIYVDLAKNIHSSPWAKNYMIAF